MTVETNDEVTEKIQKYNVGESFDCYWTFHGSANINTDPEDFPTMVGLTWPTPLTKYFVIITDEEPFYNVHEYNALWVIPLGMMTGGSFLGLLCMGIGYLSASFRKGKCCK